MTNLRLKEVAKEATNKDFYNSFFTASNVTYIIGLFGQLISSLTEFHFIFSALGGSYTPFIQYSNFFAILGGLIAIYIFEVIGVRIYLVRIIRQIVNKDFVGSERKILFAFNLLFVLSLCGANLLTSVLGQKHTFATKTNVTTTDKTHHIEVEKNSKLARLTSRYNKQVAELTTTYQNEKSDLIKRYDTDIKEMKNSRYTHRENKFKYDSYTAKIDKKLVSKTSDLNDLKNTFNSDKIDLKGTYDYNFSLNEKSYDNRINGIYQTTSRTVDLWQMIQKYTLPILMVFILLSWFAIVYKEIFLKGSGQRIEIKEVEKRPLLIFVLIAGIYEKIYQLFYYLVARLLGSTKYQFSDIKQNIVKYDIAKVNTKKQAVKIAAKTQNVRQIGYKTNKQNDTNTNDIVNVSNKAITSVLNDFDTSNDTNNDYSNTIVVQANNRTCKNCNAGFVYKHHKQLYCSDKCRIAAWEKRTGKKLKKKSKK
jgi:ribosomal protein S27AE